MLALVVGGTKDFGRAISSQFLAHKYRLITVSRSEDGIDGNLHYKCDVSDLDAWKKIVDKIRLSNATIDAIACVVGWAEAKSTDDLTSEDWLKTISANFLYVDMVFKSLSQLIIASNNPVAIVIGSRWSYRTDLPIMLPYIISKHALVTLTGTIARTFPNLRINNYCVPPMGTEGFNRVKGSAEKYGDSFSHVNLVDPNIIAETIVRHILQSKDSGMMLRVESDGDVTMSLCQAKSR